ncbi:MAG: hypothetical protein GY754_09355, partial [bacterium]|nr:hypothetical protein [bacterium]
MEIKDIIQSKRDRLFVISPECYIIFTGDSLKDEHPFIRIGNSQELQREVITLIENIIYPGLPTGSPLDEQFNLDIPHLPKNRYLGKSSAIQNFLDFQKLYDPDIDEVKIYDIQKDGSEL